MIVGNGPSLRIADLDRLQGEITFASNKIYLAFASTDWRPTYLTVTDTVVAENSNEYLREAKLCKLFGHGTFPYFAGARDIIFGNPPCAAADPRDWDLVGGVSTGHSVLYWDLELAFWMGIREVYAVGLDFSFAVNSRPTGQKAMGNDVLFAAGEANHFHPDYRRVGEAWTFPKMKEQREEFAYALRKFQSDGGVIFNTSRASKLDVWPTASFDAVFPAGA